MRAAQTSAAVSISRSPGTHEAVAAGGAPPAQAELRRLEPARLPDHATRLFRAAYAICGSWHEAEDLVQETFERVLRRTRFLRHEDDLGYLLRVMRNARAAQLQSAATRRTAPVAPDELGWVADDDADPQGHALDAQLAYAAIAELSEPLRETIVAVDVAGLSYEAARSLRTRTGTIMSRLHRAREQVAAALEAA